MQEKPIILIYDINNTLVDEMAALLMQTNRYIVINTFNEANAMEVFHQHERGFGFLTNKLACIITGWNSHKKPRDQFLYRIREREAFSDLRRPTPVILITEDHREDLKRRALNPTYGGVSAYLHNEDYQKILLDLLEQIVFQKKGQALGRQAFREFLADDDEDED